MRDRLSLSRTVDPEFFHGALTGLDLGYATDNMITPSTIRQIQSLNPLYFLA